MDFSELSQVKMQAGGTAEVTDEQIQRIVQAGWWTGTGFNLQPWKCIVLRERHAEFWRNFSRIMGILLKSNPMLATIGLNAEEPRQFAQNANVTLVLCANESKVAPLFSGPAFVEDGVKMTLFKDVGAILQSMKLAILNEGFGYSQVNMDLSIKGLDSALQGHLELPDGYRVVGILTIGKPERRDVRQEMPLSAFIYREGWKRKMQGECAKASACHRFEFHAVPCCSVCSAFLTDSYYYDSEKKLLLCEKHFHEWQTHSQSDPNKNKKPPRLFCSYWTDCDDFILFVESACARCQQPMTSHFFLAESMEKICLACAQAFTQFK